MPCICIALFAVPRCFDSRVLLWLRAQTPNPRWMEGSSAAAQRREQCPRRDEEWQVGGWQPPSSLLKVCAQPNKSCLTSSEARLLFSRSSKHGCLITRGQRSGTSGLWDKKREFLVLLGFFREKKKKKDCIHSKDHFRYILKWVSQKELLCIMSQSNL